MNDTSSAQRVDQIAKEAFEPSTSLVPDGKSQRFRRAIPHSIWRKPMMSPGRRVICAGNAAKIRSAARLASRAVRGGYGISGPIWNYMFDSTVHDLAATDGTFVLARLPEPRIEPEIVLHLASAPRADMNEDELIECVDWVAHGFEIVNSIFPGWAFTAADAVATYGVHSALLLGDRHVISGNRRRWAEEISSFTVEMESDDGVRTCGHAQNVLGGPLKALRFLVEELARRPRSEPLAPEELVTTGTLTEALPAIVGQSWSTDLHEVDIQGLRLHFR